MRQTPITASGNTTLKSPRFEAAGTCLQQCPLDLLGDRFETAPKSPQGGDMKRHVVALAIALCLPASSVVAQEAGTASGKGTMDRSVPGKTAGPLSEAYVAVDFYPHFSFATREGKGAKAATWIVLTDKPP